MGGGEPLSLLCLTKKGEKRTSQPDGSRSPASSEGKRKGGLKKGGGLSPEEKSSAPCLARRKRDNKRGEKEKADVPHYSREGERGEKICPGRLNRQKRIEEEGTFPTSRSAEGKGKKRQTGRPVLGRKRESERRKCSPVILVRGGDRHGERRGD